MKRDKKHCFSCGAAESIGLGECKCECHAQGKCPHNLAKKYCAECGQLKSDECIGCCLDIQAGVKKRGSKTCGKAGNEVFKE